MTNSDFGTKHNESIRASAGGFGFPMEVDSFGKCRLSKGTLKSEKLAGMVSR